MQILFEFTATQREMLRRAGLRPGAVAVRNMRVGSGADAVWAKCPVIGSRQGSETLVLPDGQVMTKLAGDAAR